MEANVSHSHGAGLLTNREGELIQLVNFVFLTGFVSLLGTIGNVINMIVFYKQGLDTTINISFFSMALSDFCCLLLQQWFNICVNPLFENADLIIVPSEVQVIAASIPRECFARITFLITVYITAERCICIAFPLHVKQIITPRRTIVAIILIYAVILLSIFPMFCTTYIGWKFYPAKNKTLLGLKYTSNRVEVESIVLFIHAIIAVLSFVAVVILTAVLIRKLGEKMAWRNASSTDRDKNESVSQRDRKTSRTVALIASILIACYLPSMLLCAAMFMVPGFTITGKYANLLMSLWSFAFLFEAINSSVNILLYLRMSSKYKQAFLELFSQCRCSAQILT